MSVFPKPAYYPKPFVIAHGSMLAADPDADGDGEAEDEAEGRELSDLETEVDDETSKNFPFPGVFLLSRLQDVPLCSVLVRVVQLVVLPWKISLFHSCLQNTHGPCMRPRWISLVVFLPTATVLSTLGTHTICGLMSAIPNPVSFGLREWQRLREAEAGEAERQR